MYIVSSILDIVSGSLWSGSLDASFTHVVIDSRKVTEKRAFVALPGEHCHGNAYVGAAAEKGAPVIFVEGEVPKDQVEVLKKSNAAVIVVTNCQDALWSLAEYQRARLERALVIGITGSSGKTTAKAFVKAVCETTYKTHATAGNYNNHLGVPLTIISAPLDTEVLVVEMGMNNPGEIQELARLTKPHIGAITSIGTSHIGRLGSKEAIAAAKSELIAELPPTKRTDQHPSRAFLPYDSEYLRQIVEQVAIPGGIFVATFALDGSADFSASKVSISLSGTSFLYKPIVGEQIMVNLSLTGEHMVKNALIALMVADYLSIPAAVAAQALHEVQPEAHRQTWITTKQGIQLIDDTYNANPDSMRAALRVLASCSSERLAVIGTMGELGDMAHHEHMKLGEYIASLNIDKLCIIGDFSQDLRKGAESAGLSSEKIREANSVEEAVSWICEQAKSGDTVLIKASRSERLERVIEGVMLAC